VALRHIVLFAVFLAAGCNRAAPPREEPPELEGLSETRWTPRTELFVEFAPLVVGETSRFAIHLTRLDTFKAITDGRVEVHLRAGSGAPEVFRVDGPSRPGIFGVDVKPARAGTRELVIRLQSTAVSDEQIVGTVSVHANAEAARAAGDHGEGGPPGISFLKEQQWVMEFATALVEEHALQESLRVPAQVVARPGGTADVVAPTAGRLSTVRDVTVGSTVTRGQELARVVPPPSDPSEVPQVRQLRSEAVSALEFAVRDRERAERLVAAGAAPQRRLEEARTAEAQAKSRVAAADARLAQHDAARRGSGGGTQGAFIVRAPVTGSVALREAATGANVTQGAVLFRIIDAAQVHIVGQVPEGDAARARQARAAEAEVEGQPGRVPVGRLVAVGKVLDPRARTLPILFALDNRVTAFPVGQSVFLHLLFGPTSPRPAIPASAVVDDAGRPVVYVQREGETFERRPVTLGGRAGGLVHVLEGLKPGDRVVTNGAHLVRLASLSTQAPAHGHVH